MDIFSQSSIANVVGDIAINQIPIESYIIDMNEVKRFGKQNIAIKFKKYLSLTCKLITSMETGTHCGSYKIKDSLDNATLQHHCSAARSPCNY